MRALRFQLAASLSLGLVPVALAQGRRLRRTARRLPEAPGERLGTADGSQPALRIVAVGESPLAGVGLADQADALTPCLAKLIAGSTGRAVRWQTAARGGATAGAVQRSLVGRLAPEPVDLFVIGLGVNDSIALRGLRRWQRDLAALINALYKQCGPAPVLLAGVPDMHHFPALPAPLRHMLGSRARLLDHGAAALAAAGPNITHVPMQLDGQMQALFCSDGFHPNADGHALWAEQLLPAALDLIGH